MVPNPTRILVADDQHLVADMLAITLRDFGFETKVVYNGNDAILAARTFLPDFFLSDFSMPPGINGMEASVAIKKILPGCRILLISGQQLDDEIVPYRSRGFDFRLLAKPIHPEELLRAIRNDDVPSGKSPRARLLNVDDVAVHRYSISRLFSRAGFEVLEASTGEEALRKAEESAPDLVLLDIHLPDTNGYRVCSELKQNPKTSRIPIVHVTASAIGPENALLSASAGADAFLPFPITPKNLVGKVRELLQLRYLDRGASEHTATI